MQIRTDNIYKLLRDFYTLTNIRIALFDKDLNELLVYPKEKIRFCSLIDKDPAWDRKCTVCDRTKCEACAATNKELTYDCHLGLTETVAPISDQNGVLGYMMCGQILLRETCEKTRRKLKKQFREADFPGITEAIDAIPVKTTTEFEASVTVLSALVTYLLSNQWVVPDRSAFLRHIDNYIAEHITEPISVEDISTEFQIRRTRLYSLAQEYLGCSIAKYIRQQRILHACRLLRETQLSITVVAYSVGFSDYGHFSRIFLEVTGMSASAYRRDHRKKQANS